MTVYALLMTLFLGMFLGATLTVYIATRLDEKERIRNLPKGNPDEFYDQVVDYTHQN